MDDRLFPPKPSDHVSHKLRVSSLPNLDPDVQPRHFNTKKQVFEFFQNAFRDQQTMLECIADNTPACIYVKDPEGRYLLVNRSLEILFHVDRKTMHGKTDYDFFPKEMADVFRKNDKQVLETGKPIEAE